MTHCVVGCAHIGACANICIHTHLHKNTNAYLDADTDTDTDTDTACMFIRLTEIPERMRAHTHTEIHRTHIQRYMERCEDVPLYTHAHSRTNICTRTHALSFLLSLRSDFLAVSVSLSLSLSLSLSAVFSLHYLSRSRYLSLSLSFLLSVRTIIRALSSSHKDASLSFASITCSPSKEHTSPS